MDINTKKKIRKVLKFTGKYFRYIELGFKYIFYPFLNLFINNKEFTSKLNPEKINRVLIIRHDYVGDMIVTLPTIKYIKTINPNIIVDVFCSKNNHFILTGDNNIDNIYIKKNSSLSIMFQLLRIRKKKYDLIFTTQYLYITKNGIMTNLAASRNTIKLTVGTKSKYKVFFNKLSEIASQQETVWLKMLYAISDTIDTKILPESISPYIFIPDESKQNAENQLNKFQLLENKKIVGINLSARKVQNIWTFEGYLNLIIKILAKYDDINIILFSVDDDIEIAKKIKSSLNLNNNNLENRLFIYPNIRDIKEISHSLSKTALAISPDTGFIHIVSAVGTPALGLYGGFGTNTPQWRPYKVPYIQIEAGIGKDVSDVNPEIVFTNFEELWLNKENKDFNKVITL